MLGSLARITSMVPEAHSPPRVTSMVPEAHSPPPSACSFSSECSSGLFVHYCHTGNVLLTLLPVKRAFADAADAASSTSGYVDVLMDERFIVGKLSR